MLERNIGVQCISRMATRNTIERTFGVWTNNEQPPEDHLGVLEEFEDMPVIYQGAGNNNFAVRNNVMATSFT